MNRTKELHPVWLEWKTIPDEMKKHLHMKKSLIGKWHYHYENKNGIIGLIKIQVPIFGRVRLKKLSLETGIPCIYMWEACGIMEFQRFRTKKQAEIEIYKALGEKRPRYITKGPAYIQPDSILNK